MIEADVIVVGGGPAGSSCAWRLRRYGIEPLVLDRAEFPRLKLCAGWITPEVVRDLEIDPARYPHSFLTFERLRNQVGPLRFSVRTTQHSIRRIEFDHWLLQRSGARVVTHQVKRIAREGEYWVLDDRFRCRWLVGAGGTRCPVYRTLFKDSHPRDPGRQVAVLEAEFPCAWSDPDCRLWFFRDRLPGYSWYVPKAGGHLNIGVGGLAERLARSERTLAAHWERLVADLRAAGLLTAEPPAPQGYTYYTADPRGTPLLPERDGAILVGDAASLATVDLCEGIGPAVASGILAAERIAGAAARPAPRPTVPTLSLGRAGSLLPRLYALV